MTIRPFSRCRTARRRMYGSANSSIRIAVMTRVSIPLRSSTSCTANALITLPSIPMESAATRSIPVFERIEPRTMLPPPITRPSAAPVPTTETTSSARRLTVSKSYPNPLSPASASPESLSSTRGYFRSLIQDDRRSRFAQMVADEPADLHVLAGLGRGLLHEVADRLLGIAHPRLVHQRDVFVKRLHLALDDLVDHVLGLSLGFHLLDKDATLRVDLFLRHLIFVDSDRCGRGNVLGDVF